MEHTVAIRLEGGLGDHLLGMRLLTFVKRRYPDHKILVYSDSGGNLAQLQVAAMSPYVERVIPVFQHKPRVTVENRGSLSNIEDQYLILMKEAAMFIDGWLGELGTGIYLDQSKFLNVSYYRILASRPRLTIPPDVNHRIGAILGDSTKMKYVAINYGKYGIKFLQNIKCYMRQILSSLLEDPSVCVLNLFSRAYDFPHLPEPDRSERRAMNAEESDAMAEICEWSDRILPVADEGIPVVAALLKKCSYFIGVDNGVKHLAWALGVPKTFLMPRTPHREFIFRWVPDLNDLLTLSDILEKDITPLLQKVRNALSAPSQR